ncbi:MAG TPA: sugar kinase [Nocardioidaceae bacterium]|nr:sugar kinase [Nocardioidaceae bacterium]
MGETMMAVSPTGQDLAGTGPVRLAPAGGESNVAANLAGLGHRVTWASRVGDDALGRRLVSALSAQGIDVSMVEYDAEHRTGLMVKDVATTGTRVTYYRDSSAASYLSTADVPRLRAGHARVMHLSGVTPALSTRCDDLMTSLVQDRALGEECSVSFDVNLRPALWRDTASAARRLAELANAADVVFVGLDEAQALWDSRLPSQLREVLPHPRFLVVKDGPRGATELSEGWPAVTVPGLACAVVEAVGAGDAFAAGWLAGYLRGGQAAQRLALGHLVARTALVTTTDVGAPPDPAEVDAVWARRGGTLEGNRGGP